MRDMGPNRWRARRSQEPAEAVARFVSGLSSQLITQRYAGQLQVARRRHPRSEAAGRSRSRAPTCRCRPFQIVLDRRPCHPRSCARSPTTVSAATVFRNCRMLRSRFAGIRMTGEGRLRGLIPCVEAETRVHRVRQTPGQRRSAGPIDYRHRIESTARHLEYR